MFKVLFISLMVCLAEAKVVEKIVAVVNDEIITMSDLESYQGKLKNDGLVDELLFNLIPKDQIIKDRKSLIQHMINERILDSEVKKNGYTITIERVEQEIRNIASKNNMTRAQLKDALAARKVDFSEYQDFIKVGLERQMLIEKTVSSKVRVSDDDIASYQMANSAGDPNQVYEYTIAHILFLPQNGGEAAAQQRAEAVLKKLEAGEPFEKVASQYSEEPGMSSGGLLGTFKAGEISKEIEKAITGLKVGGNSKVVTAKSGVHIFKVLKKSLVKNPKLEAQSEQVRELLFQQGFKRQLKAWIDQKRSEAFIRIN